MVNAMEVLQEMQTWWDTRGPNQPRTPELALNVGITWLYNRGYPEFTKMVLESSRLAHFRSLFTVWKAVCLRMKGNGRDTVAPYYDERIDAVKAFPLYVEKTLPDLFVQLQLNRIFLGVTFTAEEQARHEQLRRYYMREPLPLSPRMRRAANAMTNRPLPPVQR